MTAVWDKIENLAQQFELKFNQTGEIIPGTLEQDYNWHNVLWTSPRYRRAHVEVVDKRKNHKMFILHCTVFPHYNDPSPIFGFDAVCGPNKITGAFHDFSSAGDPTSFMYLWFKARVHSLEWNKPRQLPEWARQIFSPAMVAAGNLQEESEIDQLCNTALTTLDFYLKNVGLEQESGFDFHMAQDRYCFYQKKNPHVLKSMVSMGVSEPIMQRFIQEILFPESDLIRIS
jgi:hypothetical protein